MKNILDNRVFVSESLLQKKISKDWIVNVYDDYFDNELLTLDESNNLFYTLKSNIKNDVNKIIKLSKGKLEGIASGIMYENLDDKEWLKSALITEVFRNFYISKNAGGINTKKLQNKIYKSMIDGELNFLIGWGQAKRYCGGLKTEGHNADFCEFYAILTLCMIIETISEISTKKVNLTVLTGGSRFHSALFTDINNIIEYDNQRQLISDFLISKNTSILFSPYNNKIDDALNLNEFYKLITESHIDVNFNSLLINIDWLSILTQPDLYPHGIKVPSIILEYINNNGDIDLLIRMAIVAILNKDSHSYWIDNIGNMELFDETVDFFYQITKKSTKNYIAIHLKDADIDATLKIKSNSNVIRLTVHEKKDRNDIPAIFTLGKKGANKLSQHVCCLVTKQGIVFETVFEMLIRMNKSHSRIKKINVPNIELFSWLYNSKQPLFYSDLPKKDFMNILLNLKLMYD